MSVYTLCTSFLFLYILYTDRHVFPNKRYKKWVPIPIKISIEHPYITYLAIQISIFRNYFAFHYFIIHRAYPHQRRGLIGRFPHQAIHGFLSILIPACQWLPLCQFSFRNFSFLQSATKPVAFRQWIIILFLNLGFIHLHLSPCQLRAV